MKGRGQVRGGGRLPVEGQQKGLQAHDEAAEGASDGEDAGEA